MYEIGSGPLKFGQLDPVPPAAERLDIRALREIPYLNAVSVDIDEVDHIGREAGGVVLDPPYQRGHVWEAAQESAFIGYLLKGGKCPPIWANRYEDAQTGGKDWLDLPVTIIDGKQRLTALIHWTQGEIPATLNGKDIWYGDLSIADRRMLPHLDVVYVNMTVTDQMKLYLNLNSGIAHSSEELDRVRSLVLGGNPRHEETAE